jgi:hypothetical protein
LPVFLHIAFDKEPLVIIYSVTITVYITVINDDGRLLGVICCSKLPWKHERISQKIIHNLGTCPQRGSPALSLAENVLRI